MLQNLEVFIEILKYKIKKCKLGSKKQSSKREVIK